VTTRQKSRDKTGSVPLIIMKFIGMVAVRTTRGRCWKSTVLGHGSEDERRAGGPKVPNRPKWSTRGQLTELSEERSEKGGGRGRGPDSDTVRPRHGTLTCYSRQQTNSHPSRNYNCMTQHTSTKRLGLKVRDTSYHIIPEAYSLRARVDS
jgi:hypothetical protein